MKHLLNSKKKKPEGRVLLVFTWRGEESENPGIDNSGRPIQPLNHLNTFKIHSFDFFFRPRSKKYLLPWNIKVQSLVPVGVGGVYKCWELSCVARQEKCGRAGTESRNLPAKHGPPLDRCWAAPAANVSTLISSELSCYQRSEARLVGSKDTILPLFRRHSIRGTT